ncbi:MAG: transglutaminase domain-containing protein [Elusimicrobiota bacterium]
MIYKIVILFCVLLLSVDATLLFAYMGGRLSFVDLSLYDVRYKTNSEQGWFLLYTRKNRLLDNSLFLKWQYKYHSDIRNNLAYQPEYGIGIFYLPGVFSVETDFEPQPATYLSVRTVQQFSVNRFLTDGLAVKSAARFNLGSNPEFGLLGDYASGAFTHLQMDYGLNYIQELFPGSSMELDFSDIFRTSAYFPMDIFRNTEIGAGFKNKYLGLKYIYPLVFELIKDKYPYQDKRVQINLKKNWAEYDMQLESVFQQKRNWYSISAGKQLKSIYLKSYISKTNKNITGGICVSLGLDTLAFNPYIHRDSVNDKLQNFAYTENKNTLPANIDTYSLEQLKSTINTPQQAEEYVYNYIDYADDHNDFSGLTKMYDPNYVFNNKRGNCTEQARLQAFLLDDNGYDMRIVGHISHRWAHTILYYKDLSTGRWKCVDNTQGKEYYSDGDSIVELQNIVYPAWLSIVVKDKNAKGLYQVDSETKWYIQDWFNNQ